MVFGNYARYYDLLYKDKDYQAEVEYIHSLIKKFRPDTSTILDIGCGTGKHANLLCEKGYELTGIDLSDEMIKIAQNNKHKKASYSLGNATSFQFNKKFDTITSLFHVLSYQTDNESVNNMFQSVSEHLVSGGLFIFDFWYGPAVLSDRPVVRIKRLEDASIKVTRLAEPVINAQTNIVDVNYELQILDKALNKDENVKETHKMRYYFQPELDLLLASHSMKAIKYEEWLTGKESGFDTWGVCCIAEKI
jgi:SAM-dependent methyltransferase